MGQYITEWNFVNFTLPKLTAPQGCGIVVAVNLRACLPKGRPTAVGQKGITGNGDASRAWKGEERWSLFPSAFKVRRLFFIRRLPNSTHDRRHYCDSTRLTLLK